MINPQLLDYIQQSLMKGTSVEQIRSGLLQNGWNNEDISQAISQVNGQDNLQPPQVPIAKKSFIPKILIGLVVLLILAGAGYFVFSKNKTQIQDKSFENGSEILGKIITAYADVKSFEVNGSFNAKVEKEDAKSNFSGTFVLPEDLIITQDAENTSVYNDTGPGYTVPTTKKYHWETIVTDKKVFEKRDTWAITGLSPLGNEDFIKNSYKGQDKSVVSEMSKMYEERKEEQKPTWLVFTYADSLEYLGKDADVYHYKIKPKNINFGEATIKPQSKFQLKGIINAWGSNQVPTPVEGEVWVNNQFQVIREKYKVGGSLEVVNDLMDIDINYKNYNQTFKIEKPIDTTDIDKLYSDIQSGKDEKQAEKEYQDSIYTKNPDLASRDRDERRFNDVMIQIRGNMFGLYLNSHNNEYPASLSELEYGPVPTAPTPADGKCTEEQNKYKYTRTNPTSFKLTFCLGSERAPLLAGFQTLTEKGIACIGEINDKPYYCFPPNMYHNSQNP